MKSQDHIVIVETDDTLFLGWASSLVKDYRQARIFDSERVATTAALNYSTMVGVLARAVSVNNYEAGTY